MARYRFKQIRLYVECDLVPGLQIAPNRDQVHYLLTVMRLKDGAEILVFNGRHGEWTAQIGQVTRRACQISLTENIRPQTERPKLDYCFAPLKQARLDYMVQKATEMGAGRLQMVLTQHTQVSKFNLDRMRANVLEACEQCGVLSIPEVLEPISLKDFAQSWQQSQPDGKIIFCDEGSDGHNPLDRLTNLSPSPIALLIGPEGGFSEAERAYLNQMDAVISIPLGPRILRADTAAVAALAVIQSTLGDWCTTMDGTDAGNFP